MDDGGEAKGLGEAFFCVYFALVRDWRVYGEETLDV